MKCFRRVDAYLLDLGLTIFDKGYPNEDTFRLFLENGSLYVVKEGTRVIGTAAISHDVVSSFFPKTRSQRKAGDLLEDGGVGEEMVTVIETFFIDPAYMRKRIGSELLRSLEEKYRPSTFMLLSEKENSGALSFFKVKGYDCLPGNFGIEKEGSENGIILIKRYKRDGLCRGFSW